MRERQRVARVHLRQLILVSVGLLAAISLGLMFGLVIGSVSLGALYINRRRHLSLPYLPRDAMHPRY